MLDQLLQQLKERLTNEYPDYVKDCNEDPDRNIKPLSFEEYCKYILECYIDDVYEQGQSIIEYAD